MGSNSHGVEGLFLDMFLIYKQLSTQGTTTSCGLNKLDVKNYWVLWDLETLTPLVVSERSKRTTAQGL